jgi:uncharacterized protein YjiS (DUF1127 family)
MMSTIRKAAKNSAQRRDARRLYKATSHLDAKTLRDIGIVRDDWRRMSFPG